MSKLSWATEWVQEMTTSESLDTKVDFKSQFNFQPKLHWALAISLDFSEWIYEGQANVCDTKVMLNTSTSF